MVLDSISSAFPRHRMTQPEVWEMIRTSPAMKKITRRGARILETVLLGNSGIETRHFAVEPPRVFGLDAQGLNEAFETEAPRLASTALEKVMQAAKIPPHDLDALFLCTCTGYLCPGVTSHVAEITGLRPDVVLHDATGLGCGAAIPTLHAAHCYLAAHPEAVVATVAVEISSAAFFLCDDPGVAISACLFGDGASAAIWRSNGPPTAWTAKNFHSLHIPAEREKIRFVNEGGQLRNKLDKSVPGVASEAVRTLYQKTAKDQDQILAHSGGRDVIEALEAALPGFTLEETREVMKNYGNMSSPSVMVALETRLNKGLPTDTDLWLTAFGAGFAAYSCDLCREN
ncbi:MAG: 3-oxoacyl-[acyl-carrier-protein] synthase III C-terminal domain-containing protein [Terrimicrobiaceae bacterium]